jgi:hypothetical protein
MIGGFIRVVWLRSYQGDQEETYQDRDEGREEAWEHKTMIQHVFPNAGGTCGVKLYCCHKGRVIR